MIGKLRVVLLVVPGVIHLLPLSGVLGGARLAALYGVPVTDPNLTILLQHRAVLFGLLGVFLVLSAFRAGLQVMAIAAGIVSTSTFLVIALAVGDYNSAIRRVVSADVVALVCLLGAAVLLRNPRNDRSG